MGCYHETTLGKEKYQGYHHLLVRPKIKMIHKVCLARRLKLLGYGVCEELIQPSTPPL